MGGGEGIAIERCISRYEKLRKGKTHERGSEKNAVLRESTYSVGRSREEKGQDGCLSESASIGQDVGGQAGPGKSEHICSFRFESP